MMKISHFFPILVVLPLVDGSYASSHRPGLSNAVYDLGIGKHHALVKEEPEHEESNIQLASRFMVQHEAVHEYPEPNSEHEPIWMASTAQDPRVLQTHIVATKLQPSTDLQADYQHPTSHHTTVAFASPAGTMNLNTIWVEMMRYEQEVMRHIHVASGSQTPD